MPDRAYLSGLSNLNLKPENDTGDVIFAEVAILNVPHRLTFLRVEPGLDKRWYTVADEWLSELDNLENLADADGEFMTVKIPGFAGDYIAYVYPSTL